MQIKHRILLTVAFFAIVAGSMAYRSTLSYAVGNVHIVIVCSTTDPALAPKVNIWRERLEDALRTGKVISNLGSSEAMSPASEPGLGDDGVTIYPVLDGDKASPENIMKTCLEISHNAGPDDAIAVFIACHGSTQKGTKDNVLRHSFAPIATSGDLLELQKSGIRRETILKCLTHETVDGKLKEKPHRLVMLISDSCATDAPEPLFAPALPRPNFYENSNDDQQSTIKEIVKPKKESYLKKFLKEASGVVNINSCSRGQEALFRSKGSNKAYLGSLFITPFCRFATNGYYLDNEVSRDQFYNLLKMELAYQVHMIHIHEQLLTKYDGDSQIEPQKIPEAFDFVKYYEERAKAMKDSGEFTIEQVTIKINSGGTPSGPETPDSSYPSATGVGF